MFREFRPAFLFLAKFLATYLVGNVLYGLFIESYNGTPDHITRAVTNQAASVLDLTGFETSARVNPKGPTVYLQENSKIILSVYEGCNGVNVMIVFAAFLVAFGGRPGAIAWFLPAGIGIIHLANLGRLWLLYYTAIFAPRYFYYFHKYFFTAILYLIVLGLWAVWVFKLHDKKQTRTSSP